MKTKHLVQRHFARKVFSGFAAVAVLTTGVVTAMADEMESSLARGGKLYDKWYKVIDVEAPAEKAPAYPASGEYASKPADTWRCKECHGWDYKGKDGAYATGKHFTGIKGINGMKGADPAKIVAVLEDSSHRYGDKMGAADLQDVANFVSQGQVDMDKYVDRATKMPKGHKAKGAAYFNTICVGCHRKDGSRPKDMDKPLGAQMGNPWEVLHKIMNGQPGEPMPALRALDVKITLDIMDHMTTLPKEK